MKAAVCYEFGKPLIVEEVDIDSPQKGEVKVRTAAVAMRIFAATPKASPSYAWLIQPGAFSHGLRRAHIITHRRVST